MPRYDAVVVGAGPNGLAAAIELARMGRSVLVIEANQTLGGGVRSAELTLPGFVHDVCSTAYPLVVGSPFLKRLPLADHGLEWVEPTLPLAHPLDDGAVAMHTSVVQTAAGLGIDAEAYRELMTSLVEQADELAVDLLSSMRFPEYPFLLARFGMNAIRSARGFVESTFQTPAARALFAGVAAHSFLKLERPATAAFGLVLGIYGHRHNWPFVRGGSQHLTDAMSGYFRSLGGEIRTGQHIESLDELPPARAVLLNLTPRQVLDIVGERFTAFHKWQLRRYRYAPGVFKLDWALTDPIPWKAEAPRWAGTVHLGGTLEEIAISEDLVHRGLHPERPFVLLTQPSLFDDQRAPAGKHTVWAYCHVPNGSTVDMTARIEQQIERFAPGFQDLVIARSARYTADIEAANANCIGGDINGGTQDLGQLFTRPVPRWSPYRTPIEGVYICSSSTPPGGGVHGMSGYHAARAALADMR